MSKFNLLINKVKEVTSSGLPFMDGREKAEIGLGVIMNINEYGFMEGEEGEYIVFTTKEDDKTFYFGNSVLTQKVKEIENTLTTDEMAELLNEGLEIVFGQKMSKNKRRYTTCEFFPSHK